MCKQGYKAIFLIPFLSLNLFAGDIWLAWDPSPSVEVTGYKIYSGLSSRNYSEHKDAGNSLEFKYLGLPNGVIYYFAATAYNAEGNESDYSNEVSAKVITCDINSDGLINVIDLQLMVNLIQTGQVTQSYDINRDNLLNVLDVQLLVNAVMGKYSCR